MSVVAKVEGDPLATLPQLREAVSELDPALAATQVRPLQALVDDALAPDRFVTSLLTLFAVAALLLAAVGIYGVISYGVSHRMREMGIRLALGADGGDVWRLVVRGGLVLALGGIVLGVVGAVALTQVLDSLLFEVAPTDPWTFAGTAVLLASVALLASWLPARRAGSADPVRVLRQD